MTVSAIGTKPLAGPVGRPLIGLVLGSGAARGFAHIGVIHALIEHGIKPDIIVGTSIGALVGGCYADNKLDNWRHGRAASLCGAFSVILTSESAARD